MKTFASLIVLFLFAGYAYALNLGTIGVTYPISERDALEEIKQRAAEIDWEKVLDRENSESRIKAYRPKNLVELPRTERERVFHLDLAYTLPSDIPDGKGGILYPRGYTIKPLDYVTLSHTLVFINAEDTKQVSWLEASQYNKDVDVMLLITAGSYDELYQKFQRPVFYADAAIIDRFQLGAVPAVAVQKGRLVEVREVAIGKVSETESRSD